MQLGSIIARYKNTNKFASTYITLNFYFLQLENFDLRSIPGHRIDNLYDIREHFIKNPTSTDCQVETFHFQANAIKSLISLRSYELIVTHKK